jgi:hypothetical protein
MRIIRQIRGQSTTITGFAYAIAESGGSFFIATGDFRLAQCRSRPIKTDDAVNPEKIVGTDLVLSDFVCGVGLEND